MADVTKAQVKARVRLIRNGIAIYDQEFDSGKDDFTESSQQRVVLAPSSGNQQVNLDGVATGAKLLVLTDRPIKVAVNTSTYQVPVSDVLMLTSNSLTALWLENEDATFSATVTVVVTD